MYKEGQIIRRKVIASLKHEIPQLTPQMELKLIQMWLHGKSDASRRGYLTDVHHFLDFCQKRLDNIELADIQDWDTSLAQKYAPATRKRKLAAIKSLFSFAHQNKLLADNPGWLSPYLKPKMRSQRRF